MKSKSFFPSVFGALLFIIGVLMGLSLSAVVTWGESEAVLYTIFHGDSRMSLKCPLMLAPHETGTIRARIVNYTKDDIKPEVSAEISHVPSPRRIDQIVTLQPYGSENLSWTVDAGDVIFNHLILVNILQGRYRDNLSMQGSCGIFLFSLFNLTGMETFMLVLSASLASMASGGIIWVRTRLPLDYYSINLARISATLMTITVLALLSAFPRWWGLTLFLDALILLVSAIIFIDFVLFAQNYKDQNLSSSGKR